MRVLLVSDVYFPRVNGVSTSVRTFRRDLAACDVETVLVAPDYAANDDASEEQIIRVPSAAVPGDPEDRRMRWSALMRALAPLAEFDLVHIHTPFVAHYAGVRCARRLNIPCVATYHTFFAEYLHHYVPLLPRALGRGLARAFTRSQCQAVSALIAPSEPMRAVLLDYGVTTPIHVIPTGLCADRFKRGDGARFRAAHALPADRPLMLYIGRVAHEKNIGFLLQAFARARTRVPDAIFVIAGEGPARESLRELAARLGVAAAVHFVGYLKRDTELLDCYAAADAFVFASRTETQGLVLLEAMAQGAPKKWSRLRRPQCASSRMRTCAHGSPRRAGAMRPNGHRSPWHGACTSSIARSSRQACRTRARGTSPWRFDTFCVVISRQLI